MSRMNNGRQHDHPTTPRWRTVQFAACAALALVAGRAATAAIDENTSPGTTTRPTATAPARADAQSNVDAAGSDSTVWIRFGRYDSQDRLLLNAFAFRSLKKPDKSDSDGGQTDKQADSKPAYERDFRRLPIAEEVGRVPLMAVCGDRLFVIFDDGTHQSYSANGRDVELKLPQSAVPEVIAGATSAPGNGESESAALYFAIVRRSVAQRVADESRRRAAMTQPAGTMPTPGPAVAPAPGPAPAPTPVPGDASTSDANDSPAPAEPAGPAGRTNDSANDGEPTATSAPARIGPEPPAYDVIAYHRTGWQYVMPLNVWPEGRTPPEFQLCAVRNTAYVLWIDDAHGDAAPVIRCARGDDGRWDAPTTLTPAGHVVWWKALTLGDAPAVVAAAAEPPAPASAPAAPTATRSADSIVWRVWRLNGGQWSAGAPLAFDADLPDQTTGHVAVASHGEDVLVATLSRDGEPMAGVWPAAGGSPRKPFAAIPAFEPTQRPLVDARVREWAGLIATLVIIVLLMWRRQRSLALPARLPPGYALARYWKRVLAAVLDLIPAVTVTSWLWLPPLVAVQQRAMQSENWSAAVPADLPIGLYLAWLATRAVYAVYCGLFEAYSGATPGKKLLACHVASLSGGALTRTQVAIRNAMRIVEMEVYILLWPLLLMVFFTRNRQRVGDLVALTIVIETAYAPSPPRPTDDESL